MKVRGPVSRPRGKRSAYPVRTLNTVQAELLRLHATPLPWRQIQAEFYPSVPFGTLANVAAGRDPRKAAIRLALGLPPLVRVDAVGGAFVPPDAQVGVDALSCPDCSALFIPNHPRRRRCYHCSPPRLRRS